ncbi:MAG: hypothetical protein LWX54_07250, partial [Deltaproteobacteria bacterium]|nr:hypothetical protein [Deltaproteobacteria bacterium]
MREKVVAGLATGLFIFAPVGRIMNSLKSFFCFFHARTSVFVFVCLMIFMFGPTPVYADSLINDGVISAMIDFPEDEDSYTFTANIGETVQIRMVDTSATAFAPSLQLYSPSGGRINLGTPTWDGSVAAIQYTAAYTGTYTVLASDFNKVNTGSYDLYFAYMPGANEHGELVNDGVHQEQIDLGDLDTYTFTANSGDNIQIRMVDTSATAFAPSLQLYSPSGGRINLGTPT